MTSTKYFSLDLQCVLSETSWTMNEHNKTNWEWRGQVISVPFCLFSCSDPSFVLLQNETTEYYTDNGVLCCCHRISNVTTDKMAATISRNNKTKMYNWNSHVQLICWVFMRSHFRKLKIDFQRWIRPLYESHVSVSVCETTDINVFYFYVFMKFAGTHDYDYSIVVAVDIFAFRSRQNPFCEELMSSVFIIVLKCNENCR